MLDFSSDQEAAKSLRDIARINKLTGARRELLHQLKQRFRAEDSFRFLDVGAASGDMARAVLASFPNARVFCIDLLLRNLQGAPDPRVQADAFALPFPKASFEVVHCSLFLHHFAGEGVEELILEMRRVASKVVLIQDLHRHWMAYYFLPATRFILRWHPLTVEDGKKSVAAGWRRKELERILDRIQLLEASKIRWHFPSFRYFIAIDSTS